MLSLKTWAILKIHIQHPLIIPEDAKKSLKSLTLDSQKLETAVSRQKILSFSYFQRKQNFLQFKKFIFSTYWMCVKGFLNCSWGKNTKQNKTKQQNLFYVRNNTREFLQLKLVLNVRKERGKISWNQYLKLHYELSDSSVITSLWVPVNVPTKIKRKVITYGHFTVMLWPMCQLIACMPSFSVGLTLGHNTNWNHWHRNVRHPSQMLF